MHRISNKLKLSLSFTWVSHLNRPHGIYIQCMVTKMYGIEKHFNARRNYIEFTGTLGQQSFVNYSLLAFAFNHFLQAFFFLAVFYFLIFFHPSCRAADEKLLSLCSIQCSRKNPFPWYLLWGTGIPGGKSHCWGGQALHISNNNLLAGICQQLLATGSQFHFPLCDCRCDIWEGHVAVLKLKLAVDFNMHTFSQRKRLETQKT